MSIRKIRFRGEVRWRVDHAVNGHRIRKLFHTRDDAMAYDAGADDSKVHLHNLSAEELRDAVGAAIEARKAGVRLMDLIRHARPNNSVTLKEAVASCLASKAASGRRSKYIHESLGGVLRQFIREREGALVVQITKADVEQFITRGHTAWSKSTYLNRVRTLFAHCKREGWIRDNPSDGIETVSSDRKPPAIFTVEQSREILVWTRASEPRHLAALCLGLFCGIRPDEISRLTWTDVDVPNRIVRVSTAAAKTRHRRIVPIPDNAAQWLALPSVKSLPLAVPHISKRRYQRRLRDRLGLQEFPKDVLRHSAASYAIALRRDVASVALDLGNSAQVLMRHYREVVTHDDAKAFFSITPN